MRESDLFTIVVAISGGFSLLALIVFAMCIISCGWGVKIV
jgi:hypothetical protein